VTDTHALLTLQAAQVAAMALRAISSIQPILGPPNGEVSGFREALTALRALYQEPGIPVPKAPRRLRRRPQAQPRVHLPKRLSERPPPPPPEPVALEVDEESPWDPEPLYEASRCQAFLMEVIRRAAHDYVLYRQHKRMDLKMLAEQAFTWLFEEEPGHPAWKQRERALFKVVDGVSGDEVVEVGSRRLTSFLSICEACNLDPGAVRDRVREMTVESIMRTGRHVERRKPRANADATSIETHAIVVDIDMDALDAEAQSDYYDSRDSYGIDHSW
jgi:hypothetical protein